MAYTTKALIIVVFFGLACGILNTYNRGGIMAVNQYGQQYVGNDDFRGWLAANPDAQFNAGQNVTLSGSGLLKIVGNDGRTAGYGNGMHASDNTAASDAYQQWQAGRVERPAAPAYDPAAAAAAAKRAQAQAAINNTEKAIGSLDTELNVGYGNIENERASVLSRYQREAETNEGDYTGQTVNNNQNLLKNRQNALQAAAQGARGLRSTLASIGALGGTGQVLANRAVTNSANQDIGEASETAAGNARTLDTAIGKFRDEDKIRREELDVQARNNRTALEGRVESKRQGFMQKMAELFSELGDSGRATDYLNRAGDLNNTIAQKTAVAAAPIAARGAAFTPGTLADYLAGTGDMTVTTQAGDATGMGTTPSSILAGRKDEKRKQTTLV